MVHRMSYVEIASFLAMTIFFKVFYQNNQLLKIVKTFYHIP
jgi:hypothetical protein